MINYVIGYFVLALVVWIISLGVYSFDKEDNEQTFLDVRSMFISSLIWPAHGMMIYGVWLVKGLRKVRRII